MRFALIAFPALALAALSGCSSSAPASAQGAWLVNMDSGGNNCILPIIQDLFGKLDATGHQVILSDGQPASTEGNATPSIQCSVSGTTTFSVSASTQDPTKDLTITIPSITKGATKAAPAQGQVGFSDATLTVVPYDTPPGMNCDFYFVPNSGETVDSGKIWGAFTCAQVEDRSSGSICAMPESYFLFQDCST